MQLNLQKFAKNQNKKQKKKHVEIILCPQIIDLKDIVASKITTFSQHIDDYAYGAHTGAIIPSSVKQAGAKGTLINHSEHRINIKTIQENITILKELKLKSCVCAENEIEVKKIAKFKPDFIAIEPKELIGGNISISTAKPELIEKSVKNANNIPLLIGAGVKNAKDIKVGIKLGAKGVLVASGVIKAKNIKKEILNLLEGF